MLTPHLGSLIHSSEHNKEEVKAALSPRESSGFWEVLQHCGWPATPVFGLQGLLSKPLYTVSHLLSMAGSPLFFLQFGVTVVSSGLRAVTRLWMQRQTFSKASFPQHLPSSAPWESGPVLWGVTAPFISLYEMRKAGHLGTVIAPKGFP